MHSGTGVSIKGLLQVLAVFGMIFIWATILHKAHADVLALLQKHSGDEFWLALARYLMRNLAGGS